MLQKFIKALSFAALCSSLTVVNAHVVQRSQTVDAARNLAGWANEINRFDVGEFYGSFAITPEYTQSFRRDRIANSIFGQSFISSDCSTNCDSDCGSIAIQGSTVPNRSNTALLADYFGMAPDYNGTVTVCPKIKNFLIDFNLYLGLDNWLCGAWFRVQAPLVYAKWKLDFCEAGTGTAGYPAGYFAPTAVANASLNQSFGAYLNGGVPALGDVVTFNALTNSKLCGLSSNGCNNSCNNSCFNDCDDCKDTFRLSDIEFALGWNFWQNEDYHVGLGLVVRAPTGNRINDAFLFQPVVGNGHHWELGGLFTSHYTFWNGCDNDRSLGIYVDAWITHLFKASQCRSFDLCCRGPLNRYMLAEELVAATNGLAGGATAGTAVPSAYQFNNVFAPVANYTYQQVDVSIPVQADVVAMLNYSHCNFSWDIGYNFWGTSCEKISPCVNTFDNQLIALKGDASVYGFSFAGSPLASTPVALGATETGSCSAPEATIFVGTNDGSLTNEGIEFAQPAFAGLLEVFNSPVVIGSEQTNTSIQPQLLTNNDVDYCGSRRKGLTHKVFTHFAYTWEDCECYIPYLGIGGFAEFAQNKNGDCGDCASSCTVTSVTNSCSNACSNNACDFSNSCANGAFSQWGIWLKGGFSF